MSNNSHMCLNDRVVIQTGITNGATKTSIAKTLGKDKSTVGNEIKKHRVLKHRCALALECGNYKNCPIDRACSNVCPYYSKFICKRRDVSPGACNGCGNYVHCRMNKYYYDANIAQNEYEETLVSCRQGFNTTIDTVKKIGDIMEPLLLQGQSLDQILMSHPEIEPCLKTLYTYIDAGLFKSLGYNITNMSLRRKVSRKISKKKANLYKKREDRSYLKNRLYKDYLNYIDENPDSKIVQMDTVYNDVSNGPFMQTFKFLSYGFIFIVYHESKDATSMNDGLLLLEKILGEDLFNQEVQVLLTDRGSEFLQMPNIEYRDDNTLRTRVFYCDPMASSQKGSLENNHEEIRYICPKQSNLYDLGLNSQDKANLMISHINSAPKRKLNGKSPIELIKFFKPTMFEKLEAYGIKEIDKDFVILKPTLLK